MAESEAARKFDEHKLRIDLIPASSVVALATVLTHGAEKYGDRNWERGLAWSRVYAAAQRHLWAWFGGETVDPESGLNHLWHAFCNLAFLIEYEKTHAELDDRVNREKEKTCEDKPAEAVPSPETIKSAVPTEPTMRQLEAEGKATVCFITYINRDILDYVNNHRHVRFDCEGIACDDCPLYAMTASEIIKKYEMKA